MILLKFMAWNSQPTRRDDPGNNAAARDLVIECSKYDVEHFPETKEAIVRTYKPGTDMPLDVVLMGPPLVGAELNRYRRLYVMNEAGKTIDSYSPEERRG